MSIRTFWVLAAIVLPAAGLRAQPVLTEPPEFPPARPGPGAVQSGQGCFPLARGTITPGDVDWVQITIPQASTQTVVDVDFPTNGAGSALLASIVGGSTFFNISDNNNARDAMCGLSASTTPSGSLRDSAVSLGATGQNVVIDMAITGAGDTNFNGNHSQTFTYDVWVFVDPVGCATDSDCDDGVACTVDECDTGSGNCSNDAEDSACDNGLFCDGAEFCDAVRGCRVGFRPTCDDDVSCTMDDCDPLGDECVNTPDDSVCDNGTFCDGEERCDRVLDCRAGQQPACDDRVGCTVDTCDMELDACVHDPDDALCDDERFCTGVERCDEVTGCESDAVPVCDDDVACTVDSCDRNLDDCVFVADNTRCSNGVFCDGAEVCDTDEECVSGEAPCADEFCRESDDRCVECLGNADCDDEDFCNGAESCDPTGRCAEGVPPCPPEMTCDPNTRQCEGGGAFGLDVKPGVCPNRVIPAGNGFVVVAIAGSAAADIRKIKPRSLRLVRADGLGGSIAPHEGSGGPETLHKDVAASFVGPACGCHNLGGDGQTDLVVKFSLPAAVKAFRLDRVSGETVIPLRMVGKLKDGSKFEAVDCITVGRAGRTGSDQ